jgi:hypothetical protein
MRRSFNSGNSFKKCLKDIAKNNITGRLLISKNLSAYKFLISGIEPI